MAAATAGERGKAFYLLSNRWWQPDLREVVVGKTCDDGERKHLQLRKGSGCCYCSAQHGGTARSVHGDQRHTELACSANRTGDGVRNFMNLEIQKDVLALGDQIANNLWPLLCE